MQPVVAEMLSAPWAVLPDRLPFICAALHRLSINRRQAPVSGMAKVTHRRAGDGVISVLPFYGVAMQRSDAYGEALGLLSLWHFTRNLRAALADHTVRGIVIDIDSPGGSAYGIAELADEIYGARGRKRIFSAAYSLAAGGAHWIASAANEFYVTPGGEVGGIGVYDMHVDVSKGLENSGICTTMIPAGKYKIERNPFQPLGADSRTAMQKRVDG